MCFICTITHYKNRDSIKHSIRESLMDMSANVLATNATDELKVFYAKSLTDAARLVLQSLGDRETVDEVSKARSDFAAKMRPIVEVELMKQSAEFYTKYGVVPPPEVSNAIEARIWEEKESAYFAQLERSHTVQPE